MHFFTRNASLLRNCTVELLVKVLKLFGTVICLLVYRNCFKRRKKGVISVEHFSLAAEQRGGGSFSCSPGSGWAPCSAQATLQGNIPSLWGRMLSPTREGSRSKPWDTLCWELWGTQRDVSASALPGCSPCWEPASCQGMGRDRETKMVAGMQMISWVLIFFSALANLILIASGCVRFPGAESSTAGQPLQLWPFPPSLAQLFCASPSTVVEKDPLWDLPNAQPLSAQPTVTVQSFSPVRPRVAQASSNLGSWASAMQSTMPETQPWARGQWRGYKEGNMPCTPLFGAHLLKMHLVTSNSDE